MNAQDNSRAGSDVIENLSHLDRTVLTSFYIRQELPTQICRDLGIDENHFREIKSRVKQSIRDTMSRRVGNRV